MVCDVCHKKLGMDSEETCGTFPDNQLIVCEGCAVLTRAVHAYNRTAQDTVLTELPPKGRAKERRIPILPNRS
jgi:hypothetical protein